MAIKTRRDFSNYQKQMILDNARALFEETGYDKTNIKSIAKACSFGPANLYNYFSSKEEILFEILKQEAEHLVKSLDEVENSNELNAEQKLRAIIKGVADFSIGRKRRTRLLYIKYTVDLTPEHRKYINKIRDAQDECIKGIIRKGMEDGEFAKMDEPFATYAFYTMLLRTRVWFGVDDKTTQDKYTEFKCDYIMAAMKNYKTSK